MKVFSNLLICEIKYLYFLCLLQLLYCLYEDQADKFDSKSQYIGKIKFVYFDPLYIDEFHRFIVATEDNVIACLSSRTGNIIWSQNLEKEKLGEMDALSEERILITVNGGGQFIRFWNHTTGKLSWEKTFPHPLNNEAVNYFKINSETTEIIKIEILPKKHAKVYVYDVLKNFLKESDNIASVWFDENTKCNFFSSNYFVCMEPNRKVLQRLSVKDTGAFTPVHLSTLDGISDDDIPDWDGENAKLISVPYQDSIPVKDNPMVIIQSGNSTILININPPNITMLVTYPVLDSVTSAVTSDYFKLINDTFNDSVTSSAVIGFYFSIFAIYHTDDKFNDNSTYEFGALFYTGRGEIPGWENGTFSLREHRGALIKTFVLPYLNEDHGISYKYLLQFEDNSLLLYHQQGQLIWSRGDTMNRASLIDGLDKFNSKQQYIGKVKFAYIDPLIAGTHKFIVATEKNEVVCLSTENGSIIWGYNLQKEKLGEIDALSEESDLITVNGGGQFVGSWDPVTGELLWEIEAFPHPQNSGAVSYFKINTLSKEIIKIEILPKEHAKVYIYDYVRASLKTSDIIDVSLWFDKDTKCNFFSSNYFICAEPDRKVLWLLSVKETSVFKPVHLLSMVGKFFDISDLDVKNTKLISVPYLDSRENPTVIFQLDNSSMFLYINQSLNLKMIAESHSFVKYTSTLIDNKCFILFSVSYTNDRYAGNNIYEAEARICEGYHGETEDIIQLKGKYSVPEHRGALMKAFILPYIKKDHGISYKLLLLFEDNSLLLYHQQGQLIWSREDVHHKDPLKVHRAWSDEL